MRLILVLGVAAALAIPAAAASDSSPPGATARCRDGTYSFSQHRRGTCSHHGGVGEWLAAPRHTAPAQGALGATRLLAARTRSAGCELGPNPDRRCSPGAYSAGLTRRVICSPSFHTSTIRRVPQSEKFAVEREYGMVPARYGSSLEIDHIVSLELGGSNDIANLFPERLYAHPGYRVKDRLENRLHDLVCAGSIPLAAAQRQIAANWQALYARVFGTPPG